jgi:Rha family phage regulatory protein
LNELQQKSITSLEVAEMVDKQHNELLKDIRRYSEQLGEGKIAQSDFFTESTYLNSQNKEQPCYMVTKKGCEFIANKLTGTKGAIFTAKYINKFHEIGQLLEAMVIELSPELQMFQSIFQAVAQQELRNKQIEQKVDVIEQTNKAIKETIIGVYDDWRSEIKHLVASIQRGMDKSYQDTYNELYDALEKRAHCDLSKRVNNGRFRLAEHGMTPSKINEFRRIDVIESDPKLKEIFTTIVKEYAIKFVA